MIQKHLLGAMGVALIVLGGSLMIWPPGMAHALGNRQREWDHSWCFASGDLLDLAVAIDVVGKSGAWFNYGQMRLGQGRENAKQTLRENPELFEEIQAKVKEAKGITPPGAKPEEASADEMPVADTAEA